jgi:hypothetical protein
VAPVMLDTLDVLVEQWVVGWLEFLPHSHSIDIVAFERLAVDIVSAQPEPVERNLLAAMVAVRVLPSAIKLIYN